MVQAECSFSCLLRSDRSLEAAAYPGPGVCWQERAMVHAGEPLPQFIQRELLSGIERGDCQRANVRQQRGAKAFDAAQRPSAEVHVAPTIALLLAAQRIDECGSGRAGRFQRCGGLRQQDDQLAIGSQHAGQLEAKDMPKTSELLKEAARNRHEWVALSPGARPSWYWVRWGDQSSGSTMSPSASRLMMFIARIRSGDVSEVPLVNVVS